MKKKYKGFTTHHANQSSEDLKLSKLIQDYAIQENLSVPEVLNRVSYLACSLLGFTCDQLKEGTPVLSLNCVEYPGANVTCINFTIAFRPEVYDQQDALAEYFVAVARKFFQEATPAGDGIPNPGVKH